MDPELLLAYQEVDALTPATPPIAPVYGPEEGPLAKLDDIRERQRSIQHAVLAAKDDRGVERLRAAFYELDRQWEATEIARLQQNASLEARGVAQDSGRALLVEALTQAGISQYAMDQITRLRVPAGVFPVGDRLNHPSAGQVTATTRFRVITWRTAVYGARGGRRPARRA